MTKNFEAFLRLPTTEQEKYRGRYIVMIEGKVIASGSEIDKILPTIIRRYPKKTPLVAKIPVSGAMVLW